MVLIIKRQNHDDCFVASMSDHGNPYGNPNYQRLMELIDNFDLEDILFRIRVYRLIIDRLISQNKLHINNKYKDSDNTNTLHDALVKYFHQNGVRKYFIEVSDDVFRTKYLN